jgi:hypothetical protein
MAPKIEFLDKCTLLQACEWIAFKWQPMLPIYEDVSGRNQPSPFDSDAPHNKSIKIAANHLKLTLYQKDIIARGKPEFMDIPDDLDSGHMGAYTGTKCAYEYAKNIKNVNFVAQRPDDSGIDDRGRIEIKNIPQDVSLNAGANNITINLIRYVDVEIDFAELQRAFPDNAASATRPEIGSYTTPYINVMLEVIQEEKLSPENQGKAEYLATVIREKLEKLGVRASDKLSTAMATIIRLPESQEPWKKKKNNSHTG